MSVVEDWRQLQGHLIPEHLDDGVNGASGVGMRVFVHGTGNFAEGAVAAGLKLLLKAHSTGSGNVTPEVSVPLAEFQANLAATRPDWIDDES
jgi:hypothetical protein